MLFSEFKIEKYHKDIINISQMLTKLMLNQERESLTSLFSLVELMSCRLTREELRATKLSYEGGCGLEVRTSSSQDLRPGDKVSSLAQCGSLYICFNPLNHYLSQKLKLNGKSSSQTPKCPLNSSETVLFKRLIFQIVEVNIELLLQTDWQAGILSGPAWCFPVTLSWSKISPVRPAGKSEKLLQLLFPTLEVWPHRPSWKGLFAVRWRSG